MTTRRDICDIKCLKRGFVKILKEDESFEEDMQELTALAASAEGGVRPLPAPDWRRGRGGPGPSPSGSIMWRLSAAAARVFHRWSVTGPSPSLRLPPTHCAEDDLSKPSPVVHIRPPFENSSADSQNGDGEEKRKREREQSARFYSKQLSRFSGLDAIGW
ncbi:uncharacterized protein LOC144489047, partial [Mustelus asterias]